ncbi:MAG TPA: zinc-binding alcohol dehydrogenase family protein [Ktedonobacteraceae bacterium]|nr:zinc-binding alcohol dehydrogenase family protein [Ktedonobacteraceae bacterium]
MKAVGLYRYLPITDAESLVDVEIAKPVASGRDLLIQIKAISVNPVDTKMRASVSQGASTPRILGFDVAGVVEQVGQDCVLFKAGDEVYYAGSNVRAGGNSEFHLVDERIVGNKPRSLNFAQAAALPLTSITAWEAFYDRLGVSSDPGQNAGKRVLIIGAAGGVGSIATQLAQLAGLIVIGTASRPETIQWVREHGAAAVINHHAPFAPQLKQIGIDAVEYIFCLNNIEKHWQEMAEVIAPQGKICSIVGSNAPLDLAAVRDKSVTFAWEFMFTRPKYQTSDMIEQHNLLNKLAALVDEGKIRTTMTERLEPINAANLRLAHAKIEAGSTIGKIVLEHFAH